MRPDHTAPDLATPQPSPAATLDSADESISSKGMRAITRVTFCFAWLFGLEPFLSASADDARRSPRDGH